MKTIILNNQTRVLVPDDAMAVRIYVDTIEPYSQKRYESLSKKAQKKMITESKYICYQKITKKAQTGIN